jgi:tetratricopeptide (TPR) repeat protein
VVSPSGAIILTGVQLGTLEEYTRLIFSFSQPVTQYSVRREDVDKLILDFGPAQAQKSGLTDLRDAMVSAVALDQTSGRLAAKVRLAVTRFKFRHFTSPDRTSVVVDLRAEDQIETEGLEPGDRPNLDLPDPRQTAKEIRIRLPKEPKPETAQALLAQAAERMAAGDFPGAVAPLTDLKTKFPDNSLTALGTYLLADALYYENQDKLADEFPKVSSAYQEALSAYPSSPEAPRASAMRAQAYLKMEYNQEAEGYLKLMLDQFPEGRYALIAKVMLAEAYLRMDRREEAKALLEEVLAARPIGERVSEIQFTMGRSFFDEGLFSQAVETLKGLLADHPEYYLKKPEILFFMGESYHHLGAYELARAFLFHYINLMPEAPDADLVMARIGDGFKDQNQLDRALEMYALTRKRYPETVGALVAMMRLADAGALRKIFETSELFNELENGVEGASINMYRKVADAQDDSPLVQLALLRIGQSYMNLDEHRLAMESLLKLLTRFPKTPLAEEAKHLLSRAILEEAYNQFYRKKYAEAAALYTANKQWVDQETWPEMRHLLAKINAALGLQTEAAKLWEANKDVPEGQDERLYGLGLAYLTQEKYDLAIQHFEDFRKQFPNHAKGPRSLVEQAKAETALGKVDEAIGHLEQAVAAGQNSDPDVQRMLGELYLKKGNLEGGTTALEQAVDLLKKGHGSPNDLFLAYSHLGKAYLSRGLNPEAEAQFDAAMSLAQTQPYSETLYIIVNAYRQLGRPAKMKTALERLKAAPEPFWRGVAEQEFKALAPNEKVERLLKSKSSPPAEKQP